MGANESKREEKKEEEREWLEGKRERGKMRD